MALCIFRAKAVNYEVYFQVKPDEKTNDGLIRLNKFIAEAGICSRRQADLLIKSGRVSLNGKIITELGIKINTAKDIVTIDNKIISIQNQPFIYLILNKPRGILTTVKDPFNRPTVMNLIHDMRERVYPVGRLDQDSEGLLLFTNDGELANRLIHPRHKIKKLYQVWVQGQPTASDIEHLRQGIPIDSRMTLPCRIQRLHTDETSTQFEIEIREGRKRQIRRMFQAIGHEVIRLKRIQIGPIKLGRLPVGKWRYLREYEIQAIKKETGIQTNARFQQYLRDIGN
jgi:pseudouridine synthase